jgi:ABC-type lipoprotein export system ATPase subunit
MLRPVATSTPATAPHALRFESIWKTYRTAGGDELHALRDASMDVAEGCSVAIMGRSGSGKSTLLHLAAGIDEPTRGTVSILGQNLESLDERERTLRRRDDIGLVFQFFHLLPHLNVRDNVSLPAMIAGDRGFQDRVAELLDKVGLAHRAGDTVEQLSGGEMQRVAICRALLRKPRILLADEPTGNLDDENGRKVMELLLRISAEEKRTLIYVTHSRDMASLADEEWEIHSGILERP